MIDNIKNSLTKKLGPLPAWAWLLITGVAIYLYRKHEASSSSASTTAAATTTTDTNPPVVLSPGESIYDPATGGLTTAPGGGSGSEPGTDGTNIGGVAPGSGGVGVGGVGVGTGPTTPGGATGPGAGAIKALLKTLKNEEKTNTAILRKLNAPRATKGGYDVTYGKRPKAKKGSTVRGLGGGYWEQVKKAVKKGKGTTRSTTSIKNDTGRKVTTVTANHATQQARARSATQTTIPPRQRPTTPAVRTTMRQRPVASATPTQREETKPAVTKPTQKATRTVNPPTTTPKKPPRKRKP